MSSVLHAMLSVYERTSNIPEPLWLAAWGLGLISISLGLRVFAEAARASRAPARRKALGPPVTQSHG